MLGIKGFIKHRIRFLFRSTLILFGLWFLIFGNYGLHDYLRLKQDIRVVEIQLENLNAEKEELLNLVKGISSEEIEADLVEIQLRKVMAYARKNELVFFWK